MGVGPCRGAPSAGGSGAACGTQAGDSARGPQRRAPDAEARGAGVGGRPPAAPGPVSRSGRCRNSLPRRCISGVEALQRLLRRAGAFQCAVFLMSFQVLSGVFRFVWITSLFGPLGVCIPVHRSSHLPLVPTIDLGAGLLPGPWFCAHVFLRPVTAMSFCLSGCGEGGLPSDFYFTVISFTVIIWRFYRSCSYLFVLYYEAIMRNCILFLEILVFLHQTASFPFMPHFFPCLFTPPLPDTCPRPHGVPPG